LKPGQIWINDSDLVLFFSGRVPTSGGWDDV